MVPDLNIPSPAPASEQPSDLTSLEIADLDDAQRNTVLYERALKEHTRTKDFLIDQVKLIKEEKNELEKKREVDLVELRDKGAVERAHIEGNVSFALATVFMLIGGGLISSFPTLETNPPWQFVAGWVMLIAGVIFGFTSRVLVWVSLKVMNTVARDMPGR